MLVVKILTTVRLLRFFLLASLALHLISASCNSR